MRVVHAFTDMDPAKKLPVRRWQSGVDSLDGALGGGMAHGRVHEFLAAEPDDAAATAAFTLAVATGMSGAGKPLLWLRSRRAVGSAGIVQANGWADLGGAPGNGLQAIVPDTLALLKTATDSLRCGAVGAVVLEDWGPMRDMDLTASRRLTLAAERSGVPLLLLRIEAQETANSAHTRWKVAAAPSRALPGNAPGQPVFDISLLRQRTGPSGLDWRLEWDRDQCQFHEASLSGAMVSFPVSGPVADPGSGVSRSSERRAA